jgi:chromosome segregation ATPase
LPAAASIRLLTAQLQSLEGNLQAANAALMDKEKENDELNKSMAALKADLQKENKAKTVAEIKCDKYKRLSEENEEKSKELERELGALRKEGERLERELKKEITDSQTKEVRLNRALEEVTRVKNQMKGQSSSGKDMLEESRKKADRLAGENAKLEKQKKELITAFRKQMKLIDLLKKQKIHIEAARQLNFTEDEFSRMMENAT